jgi:acyl dehydratase
VAQTVFESVDALLSAGPQDLGCTEWATLDQSAIADFARATLVPAAQGDEVAPPLLLLSLTNRFLPDLLEVRGASSGVNYGSGSVRFNAPARAGDRLRARAFLMDAAEVPGGVQTTVQIRVEIEGSDEPACIVESLSRWMR